jgi:hypothetical protein
MKIAASAPPSGQISHEGQFAGRSAYYDNAFKLMRLRYLVTLSRLSGAR